MNLYQRTFLCRMYFGDPMEDGGASLYIPFTLYCETSETLPSPENIRDIVALLRAEFSGEKRKPGEETYQKIAGWLLDHVPSCYQVDIDSGDGKLSAMRSQELETEEVSIPDPLGSYRDGQGKLHRTF